jgi:hypothetical protein
MQLIDWPQSHRMVPSRLVYARATTPHTPVRPRQICIPYNYVVSKRFNQIQRALGDCGE